MEIRRDIIVSRIDIYCCDAVTSIVEAIQFAQRAVFFVTFWLLCSFKWVRMKGVLK